MSRSSVVLPHPEGPSSVNSSPSAISRCVRSTAMVAPNRLTTPCSEIFIRAGPLVGRLPDSLDVGPEARLEGLRALGRHALVVDVADLTVEVGPHAAGELHGQLRSRAGRALHLVLGRDGEQAGLHAYH